jgi:hypothetical protein
LNNDLLYPIVCLSAGLFAFLYNRQGKKRWLRVLDQALDYHRPHLLSIMRGRDKNDESKELAKNMLMILDRQLKHDLKTSPGLRGLFRSFLGEKTSINSMYAVFNKLFADKMFGYPSPYDEILDRLYATMNSVVYRFFIVTSALSLIGILWMDLFLLLSMARIDRRGPSLLYRDIVTGRRG